MNKIGEKINIKSVFFKIFSILIVITILILLILSYFLNSIIINNQEDEINQNNFSHLQQFSDSLDLTLSILSQSMSQCLWDKDIISYLVNPLIIDYQRTARIMRTLNNNVSGNKLVANAYLFSTFSNEIYDSNNNIISCDVPYIKKALDDYLSLKLENQSMSKGNTSVFIKNYNSKLYIFVDVTTSMRIGILIYEINIYEIYKLLATNFGDKTIYVFDENGSPIINFYDDNKIIDFNNESDFIKYNNKNNSSSAKYYLISSKNNGWQYVSSINEPKSILNWKKAIGLLFPIILCLFVFGVVFPIFLSYVIYRPIKSLVMTVTINTEDEKIANKKVPFKNEFDFIGQSYLNVVDKYKEMQCHIKNFSKGILEKLFENIILGEYLDDEYINYTLDGIDNPVRSNNKYTVVLVANIFPKSHSEEQENPYLLQLNNIVNHIPKKAEVSIYPIIIEKDLVAIIISATPGYSDIELKKVISNISNSIEQYSQNLQNKLLFGKGKIYNNIKDLKYSYLESKNDLDYQLNYHNNKNDEAVYISNEEINSIANTNYYYERVDQIIRESVDGHKKEAEDILKRILKEILDKNSDISKVRELYDKINNKMIEKVITFNINQEDIISLDKQQISDKLLTSISLEEIERHTFNFCKAAIKVIYMYGRKAKYAYINEAKNFIALNYSNDSLSLNDVSLSVGISHSYLSELFKEITNQNFLSYLNIYRIEQAKLLLSNTDVLIKDIGIKCGFNSTQNFIRVFKKYIHMTPLQYRKINHIIE